jgi:hypothetical protein
MAVVKVLLTLDIDEEEYPMPTDGLLTEDIAGVMHELIFDVDGWNIKSIKTVSE